MIIVEVINPEDNYSTVAGRVTYEIDRNGFKTEHTAWMDEDYKIWKLQ